MRHWIGQIPHISHAWHTNGLRVFWIPKSNIGIYLINLLYIGQLIDNICGKIHRDLSVHSNTKVINYLICVIFLSFRKFGIILWILRFFIPFF